MKEAACKAFYPDWHRLDKETTQGICRHCPVKEECLQLALSEPWWLRYNTYAGIHFHGLRSQVFRNTCVMCDDEFFSLTPRVTCSATCRVQRHRALADGEPVAKRKSVLIFEDSLVPRPTAPDRKCNAEVIQVSDDRPFWMFDPNNYFVRRHKAKETV